MDKYKRARRSKSKNLSPIGVFAFKVLQIYDVSLKLKIIHSDDDSPLKGSARGAYIRVISKVRVRNIGIG